MWMITTEGAFYVSKHREIEGRVLVRSRRREHLENLLERLGTISATGGSDEGEIVVLDELSDFPYRVTLRVEDWAEACSGFAEGINYGSFKGEVVDRYGYQHPFNQWLLDCWKSSFDSSDAEAVRRGGTYARAQEPRSEDGGYHMDPQAVYDYGDDLSSFGETGEQLGDLSVDGYSYVEEEEGL